ncbi:hypothetical protein, partial [Mesorhizobium sp. M2A.F.Ca.ET.039.01.1.1]|uniref:hypothetical protein n=1 Tax=Mesorhizobium sp. M2A.F.Ca.ET.039.01.1.1 TaxID=2496746 RepID=UPI001AECADFA
AMARAAMPDGAAAGRAFGSSKKGMSSEKPDIAPECSDSGAKDQNCLRFVLVSRVPDQLDSRSG